MTARTEVRMPEAAPGVAPELYLTRVFDAPRELVFRAWTDPEMAACWWGPQGFVTLSCSMDLRVGGAWRHSMRAPAGTVHTKAGVYREIVPPERIVFTFAWLDDAGNPKHEMLLTLRLAEQDGKTRLTLHQTGFESISARDAHAGGWTSTLDRFADYLASGAPA